MIAVLSGSAAGGLGVLAFLAVGGGPLGVVLGVLVATLILTNTTRWW